MSIGENIKKKRIQKGLTQKQLGELCGMADSAIRRYENGRANPKYETLEKIAAALGTHALILNDSISEKHANDILTESSPFSALASLIRNIYGHFDEKQVYVEGTGKAYYYLIQKNGKKFALSEKAFDNIYNSVNQIIIHTSEGKTR